MVGPTEDEVIKDLKNKFVLGKITLNNYLRKCDEFDIPKPTKNEVLMRLGITDKFETDKINNAEDFINFIIDNVDPIKRMYYNGKYSTFYELYNIRYYAINEDKKLCIVSRENIYDVLDIFDIHAVNDKIDLLEKVFKERGVVKSGWRLDVRESYLMLL